MDPKNLSSRKITNRLPSREGNPGNNTISINSTQDNFFRKSGKGFNSMSSLNRSDNCGFIKSDLFQIQDLINEFSHLIKMFKISSKSSSLTKKLSEIEESKDIKILIEKLTEDAGNIEKTSKIYNCSSNSELIQKLSLDVFYLDLLVRKINDYFVILHLQSGGEEDILGETHSKFYWIKIVVEKLLEKLDKSQTQTLNNNITGKEDFSCPDCKKDKNIKYTAISPTSSYMDEETLNMILDCSDLGDFNKTFRDSDNKFINHIQKIINEFVIKLNTNYSELVFKYTSQKHENNLQIDGFLTQKLLIEKIIHEKEKEYEKVKFDLDVIKIKNKELENNIKNLEQSFLNSQEELKKLKEVKIEKENSMKTAEVQILNSPENQTNDSDKTIMKFIEESNKTIANFKKTEETTKNKLYDELKELSNINSNLTDQISILQKEKEELEKKILFLSKNNKNDAEFQSYEELMQEQFDQMKSTFTKKLENVNDEMNKIKIESRRKLNSLQEDLSHVTYIKDMFLKQITELQKKVPGS